MPAHGKRPAGPEGQIRVHRVNPVAFAANAWAGSSGTS